jgi:phage antirepressor YoqD-like protein
MDGVIGGKEMDEEIEMVMTLAEVAEVTGASYRTVAAYAKKAGWTRNGVVTQLNGPQIAVIVEAMKAPASSGTKSNLAAQMQGVETAQSRALRIDLLHKQIEAEMQAEIDELRPRAELADLAMLSKGAFTMDKVAQILKLPYGRNLLFVKLRERGVIKPGCVTPYQEYVDRGYFVVDEKPIVIRDEVSVKPVTKVTQRGIDYIRQLLFRTGK